MTKFTGSESVSLEFLSDGRLSSSPYLKYFGHSSRNDYQLYLCLLSIKTQYAGPGIHMIIVNLLKHMSKKYLLDFKVNDEGKYCETGDENTLKAMFARYDELLNLVSESLQTLPTLPAETIKSYFNRLIEHINKKKEDLKSFHIAKKAFKQ